MKRLIALFCACLALTTPALGSGDVVPPDVLVRTVTDEVLAVVRTDKAIQSGNTQRVLEVVDVKLLPHFDFTRMTMLAVGRDWTGASPEQRARLTAAFRTLLVRTYANALTRYRDQKIEVKPLRMAEADTRVQIRTQVLQAGAAPLAIDYMLHKTDKAWLVFDVVVEGSSLVTNYRSSFAQEVQAAGMDGLIRSIEAKNRTLEAEQARS
jgi:phospholipid transport system substrate-binding protein